jgi:uncharacterized protein with GYD domain
MTLYITRGQYSHDAVEGMIKHPEDREDMARKLVKSAGGKLVNYYVTQGEYDFMLISEFDDQVDGLTATLVAAGTAGLRNLNTVAAMTGADFRKAEDKAHKIAGNLKPVAA